MATNDSGFNEDAATAAINNIISGGCEIHLLDTDGAYTDGTTELTSNKSVASVTLADDSSFTVVGAGTTNDGDFSGTTELQASSDISFGTVDQGVIVDVAIVDTASGNAIIANEPNQPNTTGEEYIIESGEVIYELGNA
jgi:hypothetical protein